ncbi:MAG: amidohydrolase family protein, partial [Caulobacter sp.]
HRIEHAQVVDPVDLPRFAKLEVIASMQPTHATSDKNMAEDRLGKARMKGAYAWRSVLDSGAKFAGGSDFPVEAPNPFFGIHAAVTRQDHKDQPLGGWYPGEALTLDEALAAFTTGAAYAEFGEGKFGSLAQGEWADFLILDVDPYKIPPNDLWKIKVQETWVGGKRVYQREGAAK